MTEKVGNISSESESKIGNHLRKWWYIYLGLLGGIMLMNGGSDGLASNCVAREVSGQLESFYNGCDEPIVAMVCFHMIFGSEQCKTNRYSPNERIHTHASEDASLFVSLISANVRVFPCKVGYSPVRVQENQYKCTS